ncbi:hypothetical protein B9G53_19600 [Pseudanabaena sp. SR411]|nr:hypothetical protein B9G53_19600 [Pseudanabaena sp. SR411]
MEIVTEYQVIETDVGIWKYFRKHWKDWFPALKSRTTFVRQAANLWQYKAMLQQKLAEQLGVLDDDVHLIDGEYQYLCVISVVHPVVVALKILRTIITVRLKTCITMAFMVMSSFLFILCSLKTWLILNS